MRKLAVGLLALALILPSVARADFVNGGFETGDFTGWTLSGNTGFNGIATFPHSGTYSAFFGPVGSLGFLDQSVATTGGQGYTLSYWLYNTGGTPNEFDVSINGVDVPSLDIVDGPGGGFTQYSYNFIATGSSTDVTFGFRQDPGFWFFDDASLQPAPAPAGIVMAGMGLVGFGGVALWRKRKSVKTAVVS